MKLTAGLMRVISGKTPTRTTAIAIWSREIRTILIDPGHSQSTDHSQRDEVDGFLPDHVDLILTTHCHPDHVARVLRRS